MRDPHLDDDGVPRTITRIEFEQLAPGRTRWRLWAGDVLNHSEIVTPENSAGILKATELLMMEGANAS